MGLESIKCFHCQEYGHLAKDCPQQFYAAELGDGKAPWCGQCDRETRLVYFVRDGAEAARRCSTCHPSGHMLSATYTKCRTCKHAIYAWDIRSECGRHQPVGKHLTCTRKECQCQPAAA